MLKKFCMEYKNVSAALVFAFLVMVGALSVQNEVRAANIAASQVLGQLNINNQPDFGQGLLNSSVINPHGFDQAEAVAIDTVHHYLYVADTRNSRVLVFKLDQNNELIDYNADYVLGQSDFSGNLVNQGNTNPSAGSLYWPSGLVIDTSTNTLYVADTFNHRVLVFDVASITNGEPAVAVLGQPDFISGGGFMPANPSNFSLPRRLAFDRLMKNLYVADAEHNRVLVFDAASIINGESAVAVLGQPDFISSGSSQFLHPTDVAFNEVDKNLYVADTENHRVLVFDVVSIINGEAAVAVLGQPDFLSTLANQGNPNPSASSLFLPLGLAFDSTNKKLYVTDKQNNRVLVFDVASIINGEAAIAVLGQSNFITQWENLGAATPSAAGLFWPFGAAFNGNNQKLYVTDNQNNRVLVYDVASITNGEPAVQVLGQLNASNQPDFTQENPNSSIVSAHGFEYAEATAIDSNNHRLYVADGSNHRVLIFNLDINNELIDYDADYVLGQPDFASHSVNQGVGVSAVTLFRPTGLALGKDILYVSDSYNNRVLVYNVAIITNGEPAVAVLGQPDFASSLGNGCQCGAGVTANTLFNPKGLVYYKNKLYVSDQANNRVLVYDVAYVANGEPAVAVLGQANFITNTLNPLSASSIVSPLGLALRPADRNLYVADAGNRRVLVFNVASVTNGEPAVAVLGQLDFTSIQPSFPARTSTMRNPSGLAFDIEHNSLYISDQLDNRVLVYDVASITNGEPAVAVIGQPNFWSWGINQNGTPSKFTLNSPRNLSYGSTNRALYVPDTNNHRVMVWKIIDILPGVFSTGNIGLPYSNAPSVRNIHGTVNYTVSSGFLPNGLTLNSVTGVISGVPTIAGTFLFTIKVTDMFVDGSILSDSQAFSITIN